MPTFHFILVQLNKDSRIEVNIARPNLVKPLTKNNLKCQPGDKYLMTVGGLGPDLHPGRFLFYSVETIKYWIPTIDCCKFQYIFAGNLCPSSGLRYQDDIANPIPALSEFRWDPESEPELRIVIDRQSLSLCLNAGEQCGSDSCYQWGRVATKVNQ